MRPHELRATSPLGLAAKFWPQLPLRVGARVGSPRRGKTGASMIDLYQLLGIKRGASRDEIRKAYRRKAKTSHPDSGGSVQQFSALATAHEVLSDDRRREKYDTTGEIETAKPNNVDVSAIEVIAQKLGLVIHAEQDVTSMDIDALIRQAIREDIASRKSNIADQERAGCGRGPGARSKAETTCFSACSTGTSVLPRILSRRMRTRSPRWSGHSKSWKAIPLSAKHRRLRRTRCPRPCMTPSRLWMSWPRSSTPSQRLLQAKSGRAPTGGVWQIASA